MIIRDAKIQDVKAILSLVSRYAELDRMLFRPLSDIYENLQMFTVAETEDALPEVVGCSALQIIWSDLAEIKSLAVAEECFGQGVGKKLVQASLEGARRIGVERVFALTLEPTFFEKLGFKTVLRDSLPMKVWSDCARCSKQDHCDEVAMICEL